MLKAIIGVLIFTQAIVFVCSFNNQIWQKLPRNRYRQWAQVFLGLSLFVVLLLLGTYAEDQWSSFSKLKKFVFQEKSLERGVSPISGDPGLLTLVANPTSVIAGPDFSNAVSFLEWQTSYRRTIKQSLFRLADDVVSPRIKHRIVSSVDLNSNLSRTLLVFESFDKTEIPAYLFRPKGSSPSPTIVVIPGHVRTEESGIDQTGGLVDSYQHKVALRLAQAGYVTLTFELRGFGKLGPPFNTEHRLVAYNAILADTFYKAIISKDIQFAVNLLHTIPEVDPKRIGITGVSFGGEMAVTYASLDSRMKVIVYQAFPARLGLRKGVKGTEKDQPHYCHIIPNQNKYGPQENIFFLLAPRAVLGVKGKLNGTFDSMFVGTIKKAWNIHQVPNLLEFKVLPGGHEYFLEPAIRFFQLHL